mgnify:CR=1 FL=1
MLAAAVVAVAAPAIAAETVTVKTDWYKTYTTNRNESRFGAGFGGKVYFNDKANGKVMTIDKDGNVEEYAAVEGLGTGIAIDDAGNVLVNTGFPGAVSGSNFVIISAADKSQTALTLDINKENAGLAAARVDQLGRVAGNLLSDEGAFFFITMNGAPTVTTIFVQNGAQAMGDLSYLMSEPAPISMNTSTCAQPLFDFDTLVGMGDDARKAGFAVRNRGNQKVYYYDGTDWLTFGAPATTTSGTEGFDVFTIGDKSYSINPVKMTFNHENAFEIADEDGNTIFNSVNDGGVPVACETGGQSFGSYNARPVYNEAGEVEKVEIYQWYGANNNTCLAAMFTVSKTQGVNDVIAADADVAPVYYNLQGVRVANPANGLYIKVAGEKASKVLVK